ncbi:AMP-binding protein [Gordonia sp. NB41Y]|uniref:AMP-binding protein n=1 Tax=Gordonia sp. NB41Y TaxID=875808 RepID=UPI0002BD3EEE|nr:AMP-binding protein [Gordonia sp. NB41Y]WLP88738.1 AMP-binding protein [Gordonia sp. NB41Y]
MTRRSISSVLADQAVSRPSDIAVIDPTGPMTYRELDIAATRLARTLLDAGVVRDDLVEVLLPNSTAFVVACFAIWRAGASPMPIDPALDRSERHMLESLAGPRAVIGGAALAPGVVLVDGESASTGSVRPLPDSWARSWKALPSSGSTGTPKVVLSASPALVDPDARVAAFIPREATQLVTAPLWHSTAFTYAFRGLTAGHRVVIEPGFDEYRFLAAVQRHRVTWTVLSPPSIRRPLRLPATERARHDLSSLESVLHIGGRCPIPDKRALLDWLGADRVVEVYAGSESNGLTMIGGHDWLAHPGSVGRAIGGTEIAIRRPDGTGADDGEIGEIWLRRGDHPAYRYLGAASRRTADGWDTLGDLGHLDDGWLYVMERAADAIRLPDRTVYPADVEAAVEAHPDVRGAVAFSLGTTEGPTGVAVLVDIADADQLPDDIHRIIVAQLGDELVPTQILVTHSPIRNDAGKIRRRALSGCGTGPAPYSARTRSENAS